MELMLTVIAVLQAYAIGSISFAVIFSNAFAKKDVRNFGSGNAGATNVMRAFGVLPGVLTFLCDAAKGFVACMVGKLTFTYLSAHYSATLFVPVYGALLCGVFCMLGHVFPVFFGFKGGKAVAVAVGIFYVSNWQAISLALGIFLIVLLISKIVSVASLSATVALFVSMLVFRPAGNVFVIASLTFIMCATVFLKHTENIKRLLKGQEKAIFKTTKKEH